MTLCQDGDNLGANNYVILSEFPIYSINRNP
jgi:hypothetical protein